MKTTIRPAMLSDLERVSELLVADAKARCALDPELWKLDSAAREKIRNTVKLAMEAEKPAFRQQWLVADTGRDIVGITHSILLPVPPIEDRELEESIGSPVPHERLWIETPVKNGFGHGVVYGWIVHRLGHCGFEAIPMTCSGMTLGLSGMCLRVDVDERASPGSASVEVQTILEDYASFGDVEEFVDHSRLLLRMMRLFAQPQYRSDTGKLRRSNRLPTVSASLPPSSRRATLRIGRIAPMERRVIRPRREPAPRAEHHRRSHMRRLPGGRRVIVRDCIVNRGRSGPAKPQSFVV